MFLRNDNALVTGAGQGIGQAIARAIEVNVEASA